MVLRNVVPRQGTETILLESSEILPKTLRNVVPRQGTETLRFFCDSFRIIIEKCSSPTGDGNNVEPHKQPAGLLLRNVVPRQGTETPL